MNYLFSQKKYFWAQALPCLGAKARVLRKKNGERGVITEKESLVMNFTLLINDAGPAVQMPGIQAKASGSLVRQPGKSAFRAVLRQVGQEHGHFASSQIRALDGEGKIIPGQVTASEAQKLLVKIQGLLSSIKGSGLVAGKVDPAIEKDLISKLKELLGGDGQAEVNADLMSLLAALTGIQRESGSTSFCLNAGRGNPDDLQVLLEDISRGFLSCAGAGDKNRSLAAKRRIQANNKNQVFSFGGGKSVLSGGKKGEQGADIQKQKAAAEKIKSGDRGGASMESADKTDFPFPGPFSMDEMQRKQISGFSGLKKGSKKGSQKRDVTPALKDRGALHKHFRSGQPQVADGIRYAKQEAKIHRDNKGDSGSPQSSSGVAEQVTSRMYGNSATPRPGKKAAHGPGRPVTVRHSGPEENGMDSGLNTPLKPGGAEIREKSPLCKASGHAAPVSADVNPGHMGHQVHSGINDVSIPGSMNVSPSLAAAGPVIEKIHENNTLRTEVITQLKHTMLGAMNMNRNRAVLQLHPPELGSVRIEITVHQQGEIHASFLAGTHEVKHIIQAGLNDLRDQLSSNGFHLGSCNVDVSGQGAEQQAQKNWDGPVFPTVGHRAEQQSDGPIFTSRSASASGHKAGVHIVV